MIELESGRVERPSTLACELRAVSILILVQSAWLWPLGFGGKMPVGGDVTQFFMGLMAFLGESLKAGQLPVWNDLWGYGFPALGESQMGVYYPPHALLYWILPTETAYVASLVIHTIWGGIGAYWAARRFGCTPRGAFLAAFSWSASGFFIIHLPHQWGYTTGCWLPWALGLTWALLCDERPKIGFSLLLGLVLTVQILPGHFQIAFVTQLCVVLMMLWTVSVPAAWASTDERNQQLIRDLGRSHRLRRAGIAGLALTAAFPLAAMQLLPTARLASLSAERRGFEYLSGFAATPFHLVNLVAPGLFHRSSLWRPLVWDPFHTSPEECLLFVGLIPLLMACVAMFRRPMRDGHTRFLTVLVVSSLLMALGPYVPGFRLIIALPGFSFFRAPARWGVVTSLGLAILAGKGIDSWNSLRRPRGAILTLVGVSLFWIAGILGLIELALACSGPGARNIPMTDSFRKVQRLLPWEGDPDFLSVMAHARRPSLDNGLYASRVLASEGSRARFMMTFLQTRMHIYQEELGATLVCLGVLALIAVSPLVPRRNMMTSVLVGLSVVELNLAARDRPVDFAPIEPLVRQSTVLARMAEIPRGTRIVEGQNGTRNLPMLPGLDPIAAYRTLDLTALDPITQLARQPQSSASVREMVEKAMAITGIGIRLTDPIQRAFEKQRRRPDQLHDDSAAYDGETIDDPALASWIWGSRNTQGKDRGATQFQFRQLKGPHGRAWLIPLSFGRDLEMLDRWNGDPILLLQLFDRATPLASRGLSPTVLEVDVEASEAAWVVVTQLADPQWQARWIAQDGRVDMSTPVYPTFSRKAGDCGWQRVKLPGPGRWTLRLEYAARDVYQGLVISAVSWLVIGIGVVSHRFLPRIAKGPSQRGG